MSMFGSKIGSWSVQFSMEIETAEVPCQGCRKKIVVILPYTGCPFCEDCVMPKAYTLGTEDFTHNES